MTAFLRVALLALVLLPGLGLSPARGQAGAVGLEVPAPAAPGRGRFLTGAYVSGSYAPLLAQGGVGYAVQPYLRYVLGGPGRVRPFVQYNFAPYWVQAFGSAAPWPGAEATGRTATPAFMPLSWPNGPLNSYGVGGLGALSVGVPLRLGSNAAMLHVGGRVLDRLVR